MRAESSAIWTSGDRCPSGCGGYCATISALAFSGQMTSVDCPRTWSIPCELSRAFYPQRPDRLKLESRATGSQRRRRRRPAAGRSGADLDQSQEPPAGVVDAHTRPAAARRRRRRSCPCRRPRRCRPHPGRPAADPASAASTGSSQRVALPAAAPHPPCEICSSVYHGQSARTAHPEPAQAAQVPERAEPRGDVLRQHADIGALGAFDVELERRRRSSGHELEAVDLDARAARARLDRRWRASSYSGSPSRLSAEYIGGTCVARADEVRAARVDASRVERAAPRRARPPAPSQSPVSVRAPSCTVHSIGLARSEQIAADLGGLTEAQRQHAGGHRIELPAWPGLGGADRRAHALQRAVRGEALRLVEQDDAVDLAIGRRSDALSAGVGRSSSSVRAARPRRPS